MFICFNVLLLLTSIIARSNTHLPPFHRHSLPPYFPPALFPIPPPLSIHPSLHIPYFLSHSQHTVLSSTFNQFILLSIPPFVPLHFPILRSLTLSKLSPLLPLLPLSIPLPSPIRSYHSFFYLYLSSSFKPTIDPFLLPPSLPLPTIPPSSNLPPINPSLPPSTHYSTLINTTTH